MKTYKLKKQISDQEAEKLQSEFLDKSHYDLLVDQDADGYDLYGNLLFRFRKNAMPQDLLELGYNSFKKSISLTEGRGMAAGGYDFRERKDGTKGKFRVAPKVESGAVGFLDKRTNPQQNYCRMTAFTRANLEEFKEGIPFVKFVDQKYKELIPDAYRRQRLYADATNQNYVIPDTAFTTITVNRSFRTACHQDAGDLQEGFGNLIIHNDGSYDGGYFVLPQYRVAVDVQNNDMLFVDVHKWHGNTEMTLREGYDEIFRISFVLYYREMMYKCEGIKEQLQILQSKTSYDQL